MITHILAVLGVVLLIVVAVYYYNKARDNGNNTDTLPDFPSDDYMKNIGVKCPDLWTLKKTNSDGSYYCENTKGVALNDEDWCTKKAKKFSAIDQWPLDPDTKTDDLKSRCDWIEKCGASDGTPATWIGVDTQC